MRNNPVNFNDPTGHMETGPCGAHGEDCGGGPTPPVTPTSSGNTGGTEDEVKPANPKLEILDPEKIFNPFNNNLQLPPSCLNTEIGCIPSRFETEIRFDILHDPEQLAWDLIGLGLSIFGIKSVQNAIGLNVKAVNLMSGTHTTLSLVTSEGDATDLILTTVGLYPPAAVYASSAAVVNDMFYPVTVHKLLIGPPATTYCDGYYGC